MILRLFRSNQPAVALLLPPIGLILWLPGWWLNQSPDYSVSLLGFLQLSSTEASGRIGLFMAFALVMLGAVIFNNLFQANDLIERRNQLPGLCYVIAFSWSPFMLQYSHLLIAVLFILLTIRRLMMIYRQISVLRELYDVGLFIGLASLFYTPSVLFLLACWFILRVLRPFNVREFLMPVIGMITIAGLFFGLDFLFEWNSVAHFNESWHSIERTFPVGIFDWFKYVIAAILLFMTVVATPSFMEALTRSTMRDRNLKLILLIFGLNTVALYVIFLMLTDFGSNVLLLALPIAMMLVYAVADKRVNWMISGLFYALLIAALINNYGMLWVQ